MGNADYLATQDEIDALDRAATALYNIWRRNLQDEPIEAAYQQLQYVQRYLKVSGS